MAWTPQAAAQAHLDAINAKDASRITQTCSADRGP